MPCLKRFAALVARRDGRAADARRSPTSRWLLLASAILVAVAASADTPPVIDAQSIIHSLEGPPPETRGIVVGPRHAPAGRKIDLQIPFDSGSARISAGAVGQLRQLGTALSAPALGGTRFLIAGHTSATGSAERNQRLSESRARSVRDYLLRQFQIAPGRLDTAGFGASHPLPDFRPEADQQRRVEISTIPPVA